jgi:ketosteroid isomerase-like protein
VSQENVEIVREVWRIFMEYGFPTELFASDVRWHTAVDLPDRETCVGPEAVQRMLAAGWENVTEPYLDVEEIRDAGEHVLVSWRGGGRARASGAPFDWSKTHTHRVLAGKVVEVHEYRELTQALKAVGLEE